EKKQSAEIIHRSEEELKSLRGLLGERNEKVHQFSEQIKLLTTKLDEEKSKRESERGRVAEERTKADKEIENLNRIWDSKVKGYELKLSEFEKKKSHEIEELRRNTEQELLRKTEENEQIVAKLDSTWKEFHSRFLDEYKALESRLAEKDMELQALQESVNSGTPAGADVDASSTEVNPEQEVVDIPQNAFRKASGKLKSKIKGLIDWLNRPVIGS
ncbi:MAG: hypothetical protein AB1633_02105, partial [Elusimicrobiota bacterium]